MFGPCARSKSTTSSAGLLGAKSQVRTVSPVTRKRRWSAGKRKDMDDPLLMIAGTQGLAASVDDVFVLFNKGDDEGGAVRRRLFVTGRHIERPGTYVLQRDPGKVAFRLVGEEGDFVRGET